MNLAEFIDGHRDQHLAELYEFLRIPSVSAHIDANLFEFPRACSLHRQQGYFPGDARNVECRRTIVAAPPATLLV
jgi:hypothetical protein